MTKNEQANAYRIAAEYLEREGFKLYMNLLAKADELDPPAPERDPYLVPGAVCEVWDDGGDTSLRYFSEYNHKGYPCFVFRHGLIGIVGVGGFGYEHYRVIGTPWDHAPDEAEWVATDRDGHIYFHETKPEIESGVWVVNEPICSAGYDAAVESGEVDWTTTLRRRPKWAMTALVRD